MTIELFRSAPIRSGPIDLEEEEEDDDDDKMQDSPMLSTWRNFDDDTDEHEYRSEGSDDLQVLPSSFRSAYSAHVKELIVHYPVYSI
jgi:hypothetical protein